MAISRRAFLQQAAAGGAVGGVGANLAVAVSRRPRPRVHTSQEAGGDGPSPKKVLILGGTRFLGPALVHSCLAAGCEVTLFNRGKSNPDLFPQLETLIGNRDPQIEPGLEPLRGRKWDAVLDTSGYVPRIARASAELLAENVDQYLFISTVSVYADQSKPGIVETDPPGEITDPSNEEITGETYGPLKALCEREIEAAMPGRAIIVRPGLIVGPEDPTDRFTYWPVRVNRGGEVLSPGSPDHPVQIIDVRDLADFCRNAIGEKITGAFNAVGPAGTMTMAMMLHGCWAATGGEAKFTWVETDVLRDHGVQPWMHMPVWIPPDSPAAGVTTTSNAKAIEHGLRFRPLAETVRATLEWYFAEDDSVRASLAPDAEYRTEENQDDGRVKRKAGLAAARESEVLAAWHNRGGG